MCCAECKQKTAEAAQIKLKACHMTDQHEGQEKNLGKRKKFRYIKSESAAKQH